MSMTDQHFQITRIFFSLFTVSLSSLSLHSPRRLMVLAALSKPAVHLMSNVLYRSPLSHLSDLAAAFMHRHTCLSSRHIIHLSYSLSRKPTLTWPMKYSSLGLCNDSASTILWFGFKQGCIQPQQWIKWLPVMSLGLLVLTNLLSVSLFHLIVLVCWFLGLMQNGEGAKIPVNTECIKKRDRGLQ